MTKSFILRAEDLWSKGGFQDGDIFDDLIWDALDADRALKDRDAEIRADIWASSTEHQVLVAIVREHLLPLIPSYSSEEIVTIHNPIRHPDQGRKPAPADVLDISVEISEDVVIATLRAILLDKSPRPHGRHAAAEALRS